MQRNCLSEDLLCKECMRRVYSPVRCRQASSDTSKRTKLNGSSEGCDLWEQPKIPPAVSRRDEIRLVFYGMK